MVEKSQKTKLAVGYTKWFYPIVVITLVSLLIHSLGYNEDGHTILVIKDIVNAGIIVCGVLLLWLKLIDRTHVSLIIVYSLLISIIASIFIRSVANIDFVFEVFFLKVEIIMLVLVLIVGVIVPPINKIIILGINLAFILLCAIFFKEEYSLLKYGFYAIVITGCGYVGYNNFLKIIRLSEKNKKVSELVKKQNTELSALNKYKDNMFQIIGHDVRTPFGQIQSLLGIYEESDTEEERKQIIEYIKQSSSKGNELLENLLTWTMEKDKRVDNKEDEIDLDILLKGIHTFFERNLSTKKIKFINNIKDTKPIRFHKNTLETVIRNVVSNAIKFVPVGGTITLDSSYDEEYFRITITDDGIGMTLEQQDSIMNTYDSFTTKGTENEKGSGMGLNICKNLLERNNAICSINSLPDEGTSITISLPLKVDVIA